mgnify:CR=1 FL=1
MKWGMGLQHFMLLSKMDIWRQFELSMLYAMVIATTGGVGFMIWGIKTGQIEKIDLDGISHQRADGRSKFAGEEPK